MKKIIKTAFLTLRAVVVSLFSYLGRRITFFFRKSASFFSRGKKPVRFYASCGIKSGVRQTHVSRLHKAAIIAACAVVVICVGGFLTVNYFLDKINYSDDDGFSFTEAYVYQQYTTKANVVVLKDGEVIYLDNYKLGKNGLYSLGKGRYVSQSGILYEADGTIVLANGAIVYPNGSILLPDGTKLNGFGLTVLSTHRIMLADGHVISAESLCVGADSSVYILTDKVCEPTQAEIDEYNAILSGSRPVSTTVKTSEVNEDSGDTPAHSDSQHEYSGSDDVEKTTASSVIVAEPETESPEEANAEINLELETPATKWEFSTNDLLIDENLTKPIAYNSDVLNILVAGIDYGSSGFPYGRSDSMILVSVNTVKKTVKMISLSRAVYVAIYGTDMRTRLNAAHGIGGPQLMIDTIENNYKVRIDNYVTIGFDAFKTMIDILGGVEISLSKAETNALKPYIIASGLHYKGTGTYNLNGDLALRYVRLRNIDTDRNRTSRQRKVLERIAVMASSMSLSELTSLANNVLPLVTTDMSKTKILYNLTKVKNYLGWEREQFVVPHKSSNLMLSTAGYEVLLVNWPDEVNYLKELTYGDLPLKYK